MKLVDSLTKPVVASLCMGAWTLAPSSSSATTILETLEPPATPGNAYTGTFFVTPSEPTWAFGVGNDAIQDTSISGISLIDGLKARDHWISALISKASWDSGFDFDSIRPIGASPPSSFSIDTSSTEWLWGASEYVAFYWLSEAGDDPSNPLAVLQTGTQYDAFKFFTSGPDSPFAAFGAADGGNIITGETITPGQPEPVPSTPPTLPLAAIALAALGWFRRVAARHE